ncbi:MAG: APC family permease, partial [Elusimicrobia bacterium]|nr:APC family permease [Elusimicrobiota bacterium]
MFEKLKELLFGKPKNPLDPRVFHNISLIAFFAWVGLGADGLSSSCYGPEEAFLTLGHYSHLAILLAIAVAATVLLLSASYSQIIELFPAGGGGYLVGTHLIGPVPGLVSGCALLVDYVLTVAISIASSMDAIFSFLPHDYQSYKFWATVLVLILLLALNLRGVKESILVLMPIFLTFIVTHTFIIVYGIFSHGTELPHLVSDTMSETSQGFSQLGFLGMAFIFLRAFSLGGGTFTGIEAVSNGLQILREPRVTTGKRTMRYMAFSLAFTAGGILLSYILNQIHPVPGQTLNASLVHKLADPWPLGHIFFYVTMLSEGALLIVAAQAGFLDGPRVMSNMAADSWLPRRFMNLSDRLVIKDGILVIGLAALAVLFYSGGSVRLLVVMYSINV